MAEFQAIAGIFAFLLMAWLLSERRWEVPIRTIATGLILQIALTLLFLKVPGFSSWVQIANQAVAAVERSTTEATSFMFGYLGGGPLPFQETAPGASFIVAFRVLPIVLVMSAITSLLFHWGILPIIVRAFAFVLRKSLRISGPSGLAAAADIFLGIAEAPLFVRPYLPLMTRSELFTVMTCGMASVAGTVMILYASVLAPIVPDAIGHIVVASVISIPAAIMFAHILIPPQSVETVSGPDSWEVPRTANSSMEAVVNGTKDGVQMLINIIGMIVVVFALIHLTNEGLSAFGQVRGAPITLQRILGYILQPFVWLMGIPFSEGGRAAQLLGTKIVLNEFVAYLDMAKLSEEMLSQHSRIIMTYAMCGFANFASLGIMIGGLTSMVPERKDEILKLGFRSVIAGNLATAMTGTIAGLVL